MLLTLRLPSAITRSLLHVPQKCSLMLQNIYKQKVEQGTVKASAEQSIISTCVDLICSYKLQHLTQ